MKRVTLVLFLLTAVFAVTIIFLTDRAIRNDQRPSFEKMSGPAPVSQSSNYRFLDQSPLAGGKGWIAGRTKNDFHCYLFDVEKQAVLGELTKGWPVFMNSNQTRLLCFVGERSLSNSKFSSFRGFVTEATGGRIDLGSARWNKEIIWMLDLEQNKAIKVGQFYQWKGAGSWFPASPTFRYGFSRPTTIPYGSGEFFVCDLQQNTMRRHRAGGEPMGWWDEQSILLQATNGDLLLYDVEKKSQTPFISFNQLKAFYHDNGLTNDPARASYFLMWNGGENEFYFTDSTNRWAAQYSFLAKIERPGPKLKLLDPHFKFEWSDHFDAQQQLYLYSGRKSGYTNSAVYLRDLRTGQTRELVPPDPNNTNVFSGPNFYSNSVIYTRSNALWRINLDGSQNRRIFPPPEDK